jgi:hypothetical protein
VRALTGRKAMDVASDEQNDAAINQINKKHRRQLETQER